ncbi:MAG: transposase [Candidatus Vogelbacteria bacterium]|nr:transposase [Candidatus Vogelbacteria bacterium]
MFKQREPNEKQKRNSPPAPGEYYHVYNRGVLKRDIFLDTRDYARFLFLLLFHQSPTTTFTNLNREVSYFVKHQMFNISNQDIKKITEKKKVNLIAFTLMPNHFHLLLQEQDGTGISKYLQRLGNAYAKYFNTKYRQNGHLFQGRYQSVHVDDNNQLLYTSAYLHKNCAELKGWRGREHLYPWSSYADFIDNNRWTGLLKLEIILEQFSGGENYRRWVNESGAKDKDEELFLS